MKKALTFLALALVTASLLIGCGKDKEDKTITVAASSTPHAEILEKCIDPLKDKGYTLEIKIMDDYIIPNNATESGDVDANYFQHQPYLDDFNKNNGTHLVTVAKVHYEPYAIYKGTADSLDVADGAKIAVPNDPTNEARALQLLAANGLITLKEDAGLAATKNDIVENPKNIEIVEMEAALIPNVLSEVDLAVINGNYAISAGLKVADSLAMEDAASAAAQEFANILVVKEGNENNEGIIALKDALLTEEIKTFIAEEYAGAVVAIF